MRGIVPADTGPGVPIGDYRPDHGDHLCSVWTDPSQDRRAAARFLDGAVDGEAALWVQDPSRYHLHVEGDRNSRAQGFQVFSTQDVHLSGGTFDPQRMYGFWQERAGEAQAVGAGHLRAVAEMAWALQERPGTEHAPEFEAGLTPVLAPLPVSVICQYGSTRFRPETILAMLLSHPLAVIGDRVFSNPFYVTDASFSLRLATLGADPVGSLIPLWRHFLHRLPSTAEVAAFLCSSIPMFIPVAAITVHLDGMLRPYFLDPSADRLEEVARADAGSGPWDRLFACWPGSAGIVGGSLCTVSRGTRMMAEATFEGGRGQIVLSCPGTLAPSQLLLFTTLASDVGSALAGLAARGGLRPLGHA